MGEAADGDISAVMVGLAPSYVVEPYVEDPDEFPEDFPIDFEEYERVRDWWFESGTYERMWQWLCADLGAFYPPMAVEDQDVIDDTEELAFLDDLYLFYPAALEQFVVKTTDEYGEDDPDAWVDGVTRWWQAERPQAFFDFIAEVTSEFRKTIRTVI